MSQNPDKVILLSDTSKVVSSCHLTFDMLRLSPSNNAHTPALSTGVIQYPEAPALLGFNVADGALGKSVKQMTCADETLPP